MIVQNKSESDKTIKDLRLKVYKLASLSPQGVKQMLGEELFPMIQKMNRDDFGKVTVGKVTGSLLEQDNMKLIRMLEDVEYLTKEVNNAVKAVLLKTKT